MYSFAYDFEIQPHNETLQNIYFYWLFSNMERSYPFLMKNVCIVFFLKCTMEISERDDKFAGS